MDNHIENEQNLVHNELFTEVVNSLSIVENNLVSTTKDIINHKVDNPTVKGFLNKLLNVADNIHDGTIEKILKSKDGILNNYMKAELDIEQHIKDAAKEAVENLFNHKDTFVKNALISVIDFADRIHDFMVTNLFHVKIDDKISDNNAEYSVKEVIKDAVEAFKDTVVEEGIETLKADSSVSKIINIGSDLVNIVINHDMNSIGIMHDTDSHLVKDVIALTQNKDATLIGEATSLLKTISDVQEL
jgi:hypothetical protein